MYIRASGIHAICVCVCVCVHRQEKEERERLKLGVETRRERYCHWISDAGVKGQVNLGASGMTLQRDDITTIDRGNRSRCAS